MNFFRLRFLVDVTLLGIAFFTGHASAAPESRHVLLAGAATSNITPEIGKDIVGGFSPFPSKHIHDELHARCLVLDDGGTRLAFVVCDLLGADRAMFEEAARLVDPELKIPRSNLMMSCTHTHSASSVLGSERYQEPRPPLEDYQRFVARRIADAVHRAVNQLEPAKIGWGTGDEPRQVFNRRWFMKPGSIPLNPFGEQDQVKMNPPRGSADLVKPAGPTDPQVCVVSVQTAAGKPLAVLANYSLHYVGDVGPGHISADYYGVFCDKLQQMLGADRQDPPFVAILSNGTSGNINNIDFLHAAKPGPKYSKINQVADDIAKVALEAMKKMEYHEWVPLRAAFQELRLGLRRPTPAQLDRAKRILEERVLPGKGNLLERVYAERLQKMANLPETLPIPIQAFRIGEVAVCGIPCETFVETGLELKKKSPFQPTFTHSIANGYYGYMPTPEQHRLGGYETWLGTNRLEVEASVKITRALLGMLESMKQ
ncbi:MAG TPA: neutral/alkaline non-lysosomal ceramidase N-terminal domain-containing protein [Verrucomicrobiaceae bacterium]